MKPGLPCTKPIANACSAWARLSGGNRAWMQVGASDGRLAISTVNAAVVSTATEMAKAWIGHRRDSFRRPERSWAGGRRDLTRVWSPPRHIRVYSRCGCAPLPLRRAHEGSRCSKGRGNASLWLRVIGNCARVRRDGEPGCRRCDVSRGPHSVRPLIWPDLRRSRSIGLEAAVLNAVKSLDGTPVGAALCATLGAASSQPYFCEALFEVTRDAVAPGSRGYERWRKRISREVKNGRMIWFLGVAQP